MSYQTLAADLCRATRRARGKQSHHTRRARDQALKRFARFLWETGAQIHAAHQIKERHLEAWAIELAARGRAPGTKANNLAHVRTALEGIGRRPFADKMSNAKLGTGRGSRTGTKAPMPRETFQVFLTAAERTDAGVALVLELALEFGLRAQEAIRSVDSLADWLSILENPLADGHVLVVYGTKGGKTRRSPPFDRQRAAELVQRAIRYAREHNGRLVRKPSLKQAVNRYHYVARKIGMVGERAPHCLRYTYACEQLRALKAAGVSRRAAAAGVSTWLGHGDGRGTWVEQVYGRSKLAEVERA